MLSIPNVNFCSASENAPFTSLLFKSYYKATTTRRRHRLPTHQIWPTKSETSLFKRFLLLMCEVFSVLHMNILYDLQLMGVENWRYGAPRVHGGRKCGNGKAAAVSGGG